MCSVSAEVFHAFTVSSSLSEGKLFPSSLSLLLLLLALPRVIRFSLTSHFSHAHLAVIQFPSEIDGMVIMVVSNSMWSSSSPSTHPTLCAWACFPAKSSALLRSLYIAQLSPSVSVNVFRVSLLYPIALSRLNMSPPPRPPPPCYMSIGRC